MSLSSGKCVVVVDDEKSYCNLLSQLLNDSLGRQVLAFTSPHEALRALPGLEVGAVITDYHMPGINGVEFIRRAVPILPAVPFFIITGHPLMLTDEAVSEIAAVKAILPKPFNWRKLTELVVRHWPDAASRPTPAEFRSD
ncbi:MAG: response regulator [Opitutales bacterium]